VPLRSRHDGWTPDKQEEFIDALAESGCVAEAARRVGMGISSAYALRRRVRSKSFRAAWDAALDHAVSRLSDAAFARAINGVANPIFFQGEQIGERRHFDERLTMFILRYRDPERYGAWLDGMMAARYPDGAALLLGRHTAHLREDNQADALGEPRPKRRPAPSRRIITSEEEVAGAIRLGPVPRDADAAE
jgi:hypothetical protein